MQPNRWCVYIDVEAFGALYETDSRNLLALGDLMDGVYRITEKCYPGSPDKISSYQTGDSFAIVSEFGTESLQVPVAIAVALLRHVAPRGRLAKASIAEGTFADITGCYPKPIQDRMEKYGYVHVGDSLMTIFPVMGTALINAVSVAKTSPSGALLTTSETNRPRIPDSCHIQDIPDRGLISIDWIHCRLPLVESIQERAQLHAPDSEALRTLVSRYFDESGARNEWKANTNWYLSLGLDSHSTAPEREV